MSWPRVVFILNLSHVTDGIRHGGPKELQYRTLSNIVLYMGSGSSSFRIARPLTAVPRVRDKRRRTGKGVYSALFRSSSQPVPSDCPSHHSALTFEKESGKVTVDRQRNSRQKYHALSASNVDISSSWSVVTPIQFLGYSDTTVASL